MSTHEHNHSKNLANNHTKGLIVSLVITCVMMVAEFVAGMLSNSLALISDSGHMLTDALALGASLFALKLVVKPSTKRHTYGYLRAEILVALFNGATLLVIAFLVFYEAYQRLFTPQEIKAPLMLIVASIGLVANIVGLKLLHRSTSENLNIRSSFWHMLGDAISSVGVIIGGVIIMFTGWNIVDPIISIFIGIIILAGAWGIVKESTNILLEAVPKDIDIDALAAAVKNINGVRDFHDIHIWTIGSNAYALSAHVTVEDQMVSKTSEILELVEHLLSDKFNISHTTLQPECLHGDCSVICSLEKQL